jgi:hypothetical protein
MEKVEVRKSKRKFPLIACSQLNKKSVSVLGDNEVAVLRLC